MALTSQLGGGAGADTGISAGNLLVVASGGMSDDDFLRIDGTSVEGLTLTQMQSALDVAPLSVGGTFTANVAFSNTSQTTFGAQSTFNAPATFTDTIRLSNTAKFEDTSGDGIKFSDDIVMDTSTSPTK